VDTTRADLERVLAARPRMLIESGPESEWVAQHLETMGHEVVVADPNDAAMYGDRSRRVKTDKRDVAALAAACLHLPRELVDALAPLRAMLRGFETTLRDTENHQKKPYVSPFLRSSVCDVVPCPPSPSVSSPSVLSVARGIE
jgi:transposase